MQLQAHSILRVKDLSDELREIRGVASTPTIDRVGDVVEPKGIRYRSPIPLLLGHKHDLPVGQVWFEPASAAGISFRATLPKIPEPGTLKDRVDTAWHSVKHRLLAAVSIGFRADADAIEALPGGGTRFKRCEVIELSLVSIPANPDAVITGVKSLDNELHKILRGASGYKQLIANAVAAGDDERVVHLGPDDVSEFLKDAEAALSTKYLNAPMSGRQVLKHVAHARESCLHHLAVAAARRTTLENRLAQVTARAASDGEALEARLARLERIIQEAAGV